MCTPYRIGCCTSYLSPPLLYLVHLSTAATQKRSAPPWVTFRSARWVNIRSAPTAAPKDMNSVAASAINALILTGLRREEVLQSRHENLDLEAGSLYLPKTKNGKSRHVVLNDAAIAVFKNAPHVIGSPWIFPGKDPMKPLNNPTKAWHRILKAASLERCRLHDCRHTFASMLVNEGATLYQVQQLLGHASSQMSQRYSHVSSTTLRNASQLVSDLVNKL